MLHVYTFGDKSIQFLIMTAKQADLMNRFTDTFFLAQENFLKENNRRWTPSEQISMPYGRSDLLRDKDEFSKYNRLVNWSLNPQHKLRNRIFKLFRVDCTDDIMDDYLVKRI